MKRHMLKPLKGQTEFAPLCALGDFLTQNKVLQPLQEVHIPQKTVLHSPTDKLMDSLIGIMAGCSAISHINFQVRPDRALQLAFGRKSCADQSTISDTLNSFTSETVEQLRTANETIYSQQGQVLAHDFSKGLLFLDIDLTGLTASPKSEGSTKGYFPGKRNQTGRKLARVSVPQYQEILYEKLYSGNVKDFEVLEELIQQVERILGFTNLTEEEAQEKRRRIVLRTDAGFGTDNVINWELERGYQVITKGFSGTRSKKVAATVKDWEEGPAKGQEIGIPERPHCYAKPTQTVARHWKDKKGKDHYDLFITSLLELSLVEVIKPYYNKHRGLEVEIKEDKATLKIEKRRKRQFYAQEALVLLAQLAHNLLIWAKKWLFSGIKLADIGIRRLSEVILKIPGEIKFRRGKMIRFVLKESHPLAKQVLTGIKGLLSKSEKPKILPKI